MALDSTQIVVGASGSIRIAPYGTAAPTDESSAYGAGWLEIGYATDEGVKFTDEKSVNEIMAWQNFYSVRRIIESRSASCEFSLLQWNKNTVPLAFGGGTISTPTAGHYKYSPPSPSTVDFRAFGLDWADGSKLYRLIIPKVLVEDAVETTLARTDAAVLPIKMSLVGIDSGDVYNIYTNDPSWA